MGGIKVEKRGRDELAALGVFGWPTWEKGVSTFDWHYDSGEQCYLLEGRARVEPVGAQAVELGPGDFVTFPAGMDCVWQIIDPVRKHYRLG